jgi:glutaredoxin
MVEPLDNIQRIAIFGILLIGAVLFIVVFGHYDPVPTIHLPSAPIIPTYHNMTYTEDSTKISVTYFYGDGCSYCAKISPYLDSIETKYPNFTLERLEIYNNRENLALMTQMCNALNVPLEKRGIPLLIFGDIPMSGSLEIREGLEPLIKNEMRVRGIVG